MKSFPSTLNESRHMYGSGKANDYEAVFDIERLTKGALNLNTSIPVMQEMLKEQNINIGNFNAYTRMSTINSPETTVNTKTDKQISTFDKGYDEEDRITGENLNFNLESTTQAEKVYFENPLELPAEIIALAKDYDWIYRYRAKSIGSAGEKSGESLKVDIVNTAISPSMFNPMYGVNCLGIIRNTPLLNDVSDVAIHPKISDCSIRTLCALSKVANSDLGMARYKYADFMYCKDLGKVPNNHLITLRKFAHPVGDHIFEMSSPKYIESGYSFETEGDVGRLITWFDTDDNKLEDIIKFSYKATWKEINNEIQYENTEADNPSSGIIGFLSNSINPVYNRGVDAGQVGHHSLWAWLGSKRTPRVVNGIGQNNGLLRNYDNHKVYTPKNTIQSTNIYEGKLEFSHEFTLNFSYQLKAYDNINPRSAFLDLIGNILEVTYRRGQYWAGERRIIGPPQDLSAFRTVNNFIDNAWDKMGGILESMRNQGINLQSILGSISNFASGLYNKILNMAGDFINNPEQYKEWGKELYDGLKNLNTKYAFADAAKGYLKNVLGRPKLYAWNSLIDGSPTGLWHVTIGNPRNPIIAMGNLIMENATITQSGPLGIDDFPSELRVSVTLKHARPRDITEIGRMYTKGASAIYNVLAHHDIKDFWGSDPVENAQTQEQAKDNPEVKIKEEKKIDRNSEFQKDVDRESQRNGYFMATPIDEGLPNPFLVNEEHINIIRKNNWSDHMLITSLQEAA